MSNKIAAKRCEKDWSMGSGSRILGNEVSGIDQDQWNQKFVMNTLKTLYYGTELSLPNHS